MPESGVAYDLGYPAGVTDPDSHIVTQGDVPDSDQGGWNGNYSKFTDYVHASEGGETGSDYRNGFTSGLAKLDRNVHYFTGRAVRFVRRDLSKDTDGPVGFSSYQDKLASGVEAQYQQLPSLEDIYRSFTGGY